MTCREFKHSAAELTLWELTRSEDTQLLSHTEKCEACSGWLQKQQTLAVSIQTLQARTAGREAGPDVERALLSAFRQGTHPGSTHALGEVRRRSGSTRPVVTPLSTPAALRLSRFFEVGSYVALAAALLVGMFLGLRLVRHSSDPVTALRHTTLPSAEPSSLQAAAAAVTPEPVKSAKMQAAPRHVSHPETPAQKPADDSDTLARAGYTELMLCDPLSCAADTQVVRMELPATGGQDSQPQMADLVVGYDGVVRAVRLVN
jgi:hypothetical protein